jgi:hypothetical protein
VNDLNIHTVLFFEGKPAKEYFPMELRRILRVDYSGDEATVHACTSRKKGMEGAKLKTIKFQFEAGSAKAKAWAEGLRKLVYGSGKFNLIRKLLGVGVLF